MGLFGKKKSSQDVMAAAPASSAAMQRQDSGRKSNVGEDLLWAAQEKAHTKRQSLTRVTEAPAPISATDSSSGGATSVAKPPPSIQETMALVDQFDATPEKRTPEPSPAKKESPARRRLRTPLMLINGAPPLVSFQGKDRPNLRRSGEPRGASILERARRAPAEWAGEFGISREIATYATTKGMQPPPITKVQPLNTMTTTPQKGMAPPPPPNRPATNVVDPRPPIGFDPFANNDFANVREAIPPPKPSREPAARPAAPAVPQRPAPPTRPDSFSRPPPPNRPAPPSRPPPPSLLAAASRPPPPVPPANRPAPPSIPTHRAPPPVPPANRPAPPRPSNPTPAGGGWTAAPVPPPLPQTHPNYPYGAAQSRQPPPPVPPQPPARPAAAGDDALPAWMRGAF